MKCPACDNLLTPETMAGVTVDVCQNGCGGVWFDAFELKKIQQAATGEKETGLLIHRRETVALDYSRKRLCPRCERQPMMRRYFSRQRAVEIDECPACGGHWLDYGELERVMAETAGAEANQPATRLLTVRRLSGFWAGLERRPGRAHPKGAV